MVVPVYVNTRHHDVVRATCSSWQNQRRAKMATSLTTKGKASNLALVRVIAAWIHKGPDGHFVSISVADDSFGTDYTSIPAKVDDRVSYKVDIHVWDQLVQFIAKQTDAKLAWKSSTDDKSKSKGTKAVSNLSEAELTKATKGEDCVVVSNDFVLQFVIELSGVSTSPAKGRKNFVSLLGTLCGLSTREKRKGNTLDLG
jgi:hypothetical protein